MFIRNVVALQTCILVTWDPSHQSQLEEGGGAQGWQERRSGRRAVMI
jgi:hypothetical protein